MKTVLIVSPHFPPSFAAGVHRSRFLYKYLPEFGWNPVIFCVDEQYHLQPIDPGMNQLLPEGKIYKTRAWSNELSRKLGISDLSIRGYHYLKSALNDYIQQHGADLIFVTVIPGFSMPLGKYIKQKFGIPFVLDYQDPWVSKWGDEQPVLSKFGLMHQLAKWIEPNVVGHADFITSVSTGTNTDLQQRYPILKQTRFGTFPIGGDPEDYQILKQKNAVYDEPENQTQKVKRLVYVGTILPTAHDTLKAFLEALNGFVHQHKSDFEVHFIGTSNNPDGHQQYQVLPYINDSLKPYVFETPQRLPYSKAIAYLAQADALLMLGSNEHHYTASKLYPGLLAEKPILAIYHEKSSVCEITKTSGRVHLVSFGDHDHNVNSKIKFIIEGIEHVLIHEDTLPPLNLSAIKPYTAKVITQGFASVFDQVVQ